MLHKHKFNCFHVKSSQSIYFAVNINKNHSYTL